MSFLPVCSVPWVAGVCNGELDSVLVGSSAMPDPATATAVFSAGFGLAAVVVLFGLGVRLILSLLR